MAFVFAAIASAHADWQLVSASNEPSNAANIEHRTLVLQDSATTDRTTIDLVLFSSKNATLRVIDNSDDKALAGALGLVDCVAGVNGGYFDAQFKPIGLRIIDGRITAPLIRARLLTGLLCASSRGTDIVRVSEFSHRQKYDSALECGPLLVDRETRVRSLDDSHRARRTFAAVGRRGSAALGTTSELTLAQLADALSGVSLGGTKIWRAMNLDGGSSAGFWFKRADGTAFSIAEWKRVRDFVAVFPR